jgi:hypothetical protein
MTDTGWHDHPNRHRIGGSLGFPEDPGICTPGIGNPDNQKPGWRKGKSGVPSPSDHSHPLEAVRMSVFTSVVQGNASHGFASWYPWGNPWFTFDYTVQDESCHLACQYTTTFWMRDGQGGAMFGIRNNRDNTDYWVGQYDSNGVGLDQTNGYRGRHFKNTPGDHTLAVGTIIIPSGRLKQGVATNLGFLWQCYTQSGVLMTDANDFAQITVFEFYSS